MPVETGKPLPEDLLVRYADEVEAAMQKAVRRALWEHKQLGRSIATWQDGQVVTLEPHEIPVTDPDATNGHPETSTFDSQQPSAALAGHK